MSSPKQEVYSILSNSKFAGVQYNWKLFHSFSPLVWNKHACIDFFQPYESKSLAKVYLEQNELNLDFYDEYFLYPDIRFTFSVNNPFSQESSFFT